MFIFDWILRPTTGIGYVDRVVTQFLSFSLIIIGTFMGYKAYGKGGLNCMSKAEWIDSWNDYATDICFSDGTYVVDQSLPYPSYSELMASKKNNLYQWQPILLIIYGLFFHLPLIFWTFVNTFGHFNSLDFCRAANQVLKGPHKEIVFKRNVNIFEHCLLVPELERKKTNFFLRVFIYFYVLLKNSYLPSLYLFFKIWNIFNLVITFLAINIFFTEENEDIFGVYTMVGIYSKKSTAFHRVTTCTFLIRELGIAQQTSLSNKIINCSLFLNYFYEKIYIGLWLILPILFILNIWQILTSHAKLFTNKRTYLKQLLKSGKIVINETNVAAFDDFVNTISLNCLFGIKMLERSTGYTLAAETTVQLFNDLNKHCN